jgi:hypothetical protein
MRRHRRAARRRNARLEAAFHQEVQRLPDQARPGLLVWLRSWRRAVHRKTIWVRLGRRSRIDRAGRMFWEITPNGERRRL